MSAGNSYDLEVDIDWQAPQPAGLMYAPAERLSLYGGGPAAASPATSRSSA
ncbi:diiron oxygenase [Dactylosporangium matsuzakiense]|uniref:diiron oxygenase n=1 Tax=Dactylosporangium matsuzakiense TaxID=53360 RepID=UPI0021C390AA|nr:diiron oxygenase [Dactylosporangium matsuzakiense]